MLNHIIIQFLLQYFFVCIDVWLLPKKVKRIIYWWKKIVILHQYIAVLTFFLNLTRFLRSEVFDISSLKRAPQIKEKLKRVNLHTSLLCIRIFIYHDWTLFVFDWSHMIFQMLLESDILWQSIYFIIEWSELKYCYKCAVSSFLL